MDELKTELIGVFNLVSSLSVAGDAVDMIAAVRNKLRRAIAICDKAEGGGDQNA